MVLRKQNSAGKRPVWKTIIQWSGLALVAVIDGCGHTPHYDAPTEFCSILKGMLEAFLKDR